MKVIVACLALLLASAEGLSLRSQPPVKKKSLITIRKNDAMGPCNPNTKVGISHSTVPGTTDPVYDQEAAVDGNKQVVNPRVETVQICGPGEFVFSPMQCAGEFFKYKAETITIKGNEDSSCREVDLEHFAHCYKVNC